MELCLRDGSVESQSMNDLACASRDNGRQKAAIEMLEDCMQCRQCVLGPDHVYGEENSAMLADWEELATEHRELSNMSD